MKQRPEFSPIRSIIVPIIHNGPGHNALKLALHFDAEITLVGIVKVKSRRHISSSTSIATDMRKQLRKLGKDARTLGRTMTIVSPTPWEDLSGFSKMKNPDLMIMEWDGHVEALGVTATEVLTRPPCNVALIRGKFPNKPERILATVRGGPHAELAIRAGIGLNKYGVTALHVKKTNDPKRDVDAAFKGLDNVLQQLPEVHKVYMETESATELILDQAKNADVLLLGTTSHAEESPASLGRLAERVLREADCPVIAVKSGRPEPRAGYDESSGYEAISILVDQWFAENTYKADEFKNLKELVELKEKQGLTISLALPALNEEETVGKVIKTMKRELMKKYPLLDEIVLIDSDSTDKTRSIAEKLGVPVYIHQQILERLEPRHGKGDALWKSLLVTKGDIIAWIDTDIVNIHPRFVYGIIGPMLINSRIKFVKGFYRRPLRVGNKVQAGGGGRVTELTARPLFNLFFPELSGVIQPLSGEYAGRREAFEQIPFFSGYGVETGMLIDIFKNFGLRSIAQVDLLERIHHNQPLDALSKMSFAIIQAAAQKLEEKHNISILEDVNRSMKIVQHDSDGYKLGIEKIAERERDPMIIIPEYLEHRKK